MGLLGNLGGMLKDVKGQYLDKALGASQKSDSASQVASGINVQGNKLTAPVAQNMTATPSQSPLPSTATIEHSDTENKIKAGGDETKVSSAGDVSVNKVECEPKVQQSSSSVMSPTSSSSSLTPKPAVRASESAGDSPKAEAVAMPKTEAVVAPKTGSEANTQSNVAVSIKPTSLKPNDNLGNGEEIQCVQMELINDANFSDVWITPEKKTYIWGGKTNAGLIEVSFTDFNEFLKAIEDSFEGTRSYLLQYKGRNYRVERTISTGGPQFCARKMPTKVPNLRDLGLPQGIYNHLLSLAGGSGLILLAGATGSGKSTTIAALLKEYLSQKGGYAFTIEDPVELPLDGVYVTPNHELGLCKQTTPPDGIWAEGIKSALRSKPRYIYLGEIRSPDIASEALRAATSGHLVLSSIHANNVSEAVNSLVKYAASSGISEAMAYELVAGGFLGVVHQILSGAPKRAHLTTLFANPDVNAGCQVRGMIRNGKLNMATLIEQQRILLQSNKPLFT